MSHSTGLLGPAMSLANVDTNFAFSSTMRPLARLTRLEAHAQFSHTKCHELSNFMMSGAVK